MQKAKTKKIIKLQRILLSIILILLAIIFLGTGMGLLKRKNNKLSIEKKESLSSIRDNKKLFTDLGRLRAITSDEEPCTVVIFPIFEYNAEDKQFEEELVQKKEKLRDIILLWFSQYKYHEIYAMSEIDIKKDLLENINSILNLSKIKKIYFKEFVILQ